MKKKRVRRPRTTPFSASRTWHAILWKSTFRLNSLRSATSARSGWPPAVNYIIQAGETTDAGAFVCELAQRMPQQKDTLMTIAEQLKQEGRLE